MRNITRNNYTPHIGDYHNMIVHDEVLGKVWLFDCDGVFLDMSKTNVTVVDDYGESTEYAASQRLVTATKDNLTEAIGEVDTASQGRDDALDTKIDNEVDTLEQEIASVESESIARDNALEADYTQKYNTLDNDIETLTRTTDNLASDIEDINRTAVFGVTLNQNDNAKITMTVVDGGATTNTDIRNASSTRSGLMTAADYNQVQQNTSDIAAEAAARQAADNNIQSEIDTIVASSDVKDIVGTKADLDNYDTSTLGDNDIIKVLADETQNNATTYYRYVQSTDSFTLIGSEGPYYTKAATDALLAEKQDELTAGDNITIANNVISAEKGSIFTMVYAQSQPNYGESTTSIYKDINWSQKYTLDELIDLWKTGETIYAALTSYSPDYEYDTPNAILVGVTTPGPDSGDFHMFTFYADGMLYYYSADDLDTTDFYLVKQPTKNPVMLQKVFNGLNSAAVVSQSGIKSAFIIGNNLGISNSDDKLNGGTATNSTFIGTGTIGFEQGANSTNSIAIGHNTKLWKSNNSVQMLGNTSASSGGTANGCVAIGYNAATNTSAGTTGYGKIALGAYSAASATGEMNIGSSSATYGYNNSNYRLLTGLYDPQNAHDAATKGYVDTAISGTGLVTLSYGNSTWNDFITAYNAGKLVYCRASSAADPSSGAQTRMAFMAYVNNPTSPTEVEFQYVRSVSNKSATSQVDQVFVYKLTSTGGGTWTVATRDMAATVAAGTNAERTYSSGTVTINPRLYTTTGQNTNGGITQKLFTDTVGNIQAALNAINNGGNA